MFRFYFNISKNTDSPLAGFSGSVVLGTPGLQLLQLTLGVGYVIIDTAAPGITHALGMEGKAHGFGWVCLGTGEFNAVFPSSITDGTAGDGKGTVGTKDGFLVVSIVDPLTSSG
jgi:hypothetical protein